MKKEMWGIFGILLFVSLGFVSAGWFDFLKPTGHVVSQLTCEGGDNSNPYKEGWVTLYNPDDSPNKSFNDFCSNSSVLTQYSCSGSDVVMTNITCSINCSSDICSQEGDNEDYMEEFSIGAGDSVILDNGQVLLVKSISSNLISIKIDDISLNNLYEKQISKLNGVLLRVSSIGNSKVILGILSE